MVNEHKIRLRLTQLEIYFIFKDNGKTGAQLHEIIALNQFYYAVYHEYN
jgi:hypothetical protein